MTQQLSKNIHSAILPVRSQRVVETPVLNNTNTQTNQFSAGTHHLRTGEVLRL